MPFIIPTTTMVGDVETECSVDLDNVAAYIDGGAGVTGLVFIGGNTFTIGMDYRELMKILAESGD